MIADPERGWAWSRGLLGIPARDLHLCGSADSLPLIRALVAACGDELILHEYDRLAPLHVLPRSLGSRLSSVRPGDCVVDFSRKHAAPRSLVLYPSLTPDPSPTPDPSS
mgnify:CR=1 FL=1